MWFFTPFGMFSAVQKSGTDFLTVRARLRQDLDALRKYIPELSPKKETPLGDYRWRATCTHAQLKAGMAKIVDEITYGNFKGETARRKNFVHEGVYHKVWHVMNDAQRKEADDERYRKPRGAKGRIPVTPQLLDFRELSDARSCSFGGNGDQCPECGTFLNDRGRCPEARCPEYGNKPRKPQGV